MTMNSSVINDTLAAEEEIQPMIIIEESKKEPSCDDTRTITSYQRINTDDDEIPAATARSSEIRRRIGGSDGNDNNNNNDNDNDNIISSNGGRREIWNFIWMSVLFSANHGCVVSCVSLATAQLGSVGAWQSGVLFLAYTASAILGSTYIVKLLGSRNALIVGMGTYCVYVACFWIALIFKDHNNTSVKVLSAIAGAAVGGLGAGLIWVAQGAYYSRSAELYAQQQQELMRSDRTANTTGTTDDTTTIRPTNNTDTTTANNRTQIIETIHTKTTNNTNNNRYMMTQQFELEEQRQEQQQGAFIRDDDDALTKSNSMFAAIFAFIYLVEEVGLRVLSTFLLQGIGCSWTSIFGIYTIISILSAILMFTVRKDDICNTSDDNNNNNNNYDNNDDNNDNDNNNNNNDNHSTTTSIVSSSNSISNITVEQTAQVLAALNLLLYNPKMKYMIGLNAVYGLTSAFLNSYVNGEVIQIVLHDQDSQYVGLISSWVPVTAAVFSLIFQKVAPKGGKKNVIILTIGLLSFMAVVVPFIILPPPTTTTPPSLLSLSERYWGWPLLLLIFTFHGIGRSTFESTLKATFADFFATEKEGAFANIIFQNGLSNTIGYILTFNFVCAVPSKYCVPYRDGTYHDVLSFELLVIASGVLGILGYWRASYLHYNYQ